MSEAWQGKSRVSPLLTLPVCCNRVAFEAMRSLAGRIEEAESLLDGAVAIAAHEFGEAVSANEVRSRILNIAQTILLRVHGEQPQSKLAHLHEYLFEELKFRGNAEDYYNPHNSLLNCVLETRLGLPITLSLVYTLVARELGITAWGIGLPGHFVVGVQGDGKPVWIDPFSAGSIITQEQAKQRMQIQFGSEVMWSPRLAEPVNNCYWLTRILQNLLTAYSRTNQYADVAAMLEMELLLWPGETRLERDLAVVLARAGQGHHASAWLEHYLQANPDDPQRQDLQQLLASLA